MAVHIHRLHHIKGGSVSAIAGDLEEWRRTIKSFRAVASPPRVFPAPSFPV